MEESAFLPTHPKQPLPYVQLEGVTGLRYVDVTVSLSKSRTRERETKSKVKGREKKWNSKRDKRGGAFQL